MSREIVWFDCGILCAIIEIEIGASGMTPGDTKAAM